MALFTWHDFATKGGGEVSARPSSQPHGKEGLGPPHTRPLGVVFFVRNTLNPFRTKKPPLAGRCAGGRVPLSRVAGRKGACQREPPVYISRCRDMMPHPPHPTPSTHCIIAVAQPEVEAAGPHPRLRLGGGGFQGAPQQASRGGTVGGHHHAPVGRDGVAALQMHRGAPRARRRLHGLHPHPWKPSRGSERCHSTGGVVWRMSEWTHW